MKYQFTIFSLILLLTGCGQQHLSKQELTVKYFEARNAVEFNDINKLINDSLIVVEGDYVMPYSKESYYEVFKWDSIFQTTYNVVELEETDDQIIASIAMTSIRNKFLKNDLMTCKFKLSFKGGTISKIESLDCAGADWDSWGKERDSLVSWISVNHPGLNGFIHNMTMKGAQNYLKAIELYELNKTELE